jgi:hypothetical protein
VDKSGIPRRNPSDDLRACAAHPPDRPTRLLVRRPRARALRSAGPSYTATVDEEARPRSGYRPGAPGGRQLEHVDEHLRAAAWMGASPLPPAWCRVSNLHAGRDHHSRDCGCRDRAHRTTSQPRLTPSPVHPRTLAGHGDHYTVSAPWVPATRGRSGRPCTTPLSVPDAQPLDPPIRLLLRRANVNGSVICRFYTASVPASIP